MSTQTDCMEHSGLKWCLVCNFRVHSSNLKIRCELCSGFVHRKCIESCDAIFYCGSCLANSLPLMKLGDDDFFEQIGLLNHPLKTKLSRISDKQFILNPHEDIDNKFIHNADLDADNNYYNDCFSQNLGYVDTDQLNANILSGDGPDCQPTIMHLNARNLVCNIDLLSANLSLLKSKFSIII